MKDPDYHQIGRDHKANRDAERKERRDIAAASATRNATGGLSTKDAKVAREKRGIMERIAQLRMKLDSLKNATSPSVAVTRAEIVAEISTLEADAAKL